MRKEKECILPGASMIASTDGERIVKQVSYKQQACLNAFTTRRCPIAVAVALQTIEEVY